MKKKIIYIIITVILCGALSSLAEIFIFNFKTLTLGEQDRSISDASYSTEKTEDNKTKLTLNENNRYVRELVIDYSTTKSINYTIEYGYVGAYGQDIGETFEDVFESTFSVAATNIDKTVRQISIIFDSDPEIKINKIIIDNDFHFNYFRSFFIFLALLTICSLFYFYRDGFRTEKIHIYFAVIASLLGLMFIFAQPAMNFYCWDDQTHFDRVVSYPIGTGVYTHGEFNMSDSGTPNHPWHKSTNSFTEHRIRTNYLDSGPDSDYIGNNLNGSYLTIQKVPYTPMAIGYHVSKFIGLPFTVCFQIGKIFSLMTYVLLMTYAIKTLVTGKRLLAIIAFLPTNMFLASSYSYDPAVLSGISIFIVHIINLLLDKNKTTKFDFKTAVIMIVAMTYACLAKAAYAPLLLLVFLIPKDKFRDIKQSRLVKVGFVTIAFLLCGTLLLPALDGTGNGDTRGGSVSVKDQAILVATHPADYASVLGTISVEEFNYKLFSPDTITNFSYAHTFDQHSNFYYIFIFLTIFAFLTDNQNNKLNKKQRLGLLAAVILIIVTIWSALYINFTPVGATTIGGVQNRYFLPLLFPLLFCLQIPSIQNKIKPKHYNLILFSVASIATIIMIYSYILVPYNF